MSIKEEQPEALRLAEKLDSFEFDEPHETANKLRAQHELIQKLKAALAMSLPAVEHFKFLEDAAYGKNFSEFRSIKTNSDLRYVKEALAAAEAHK